MPMGWEPGPEVNVDRARSAIHAAFPNVDAAHLRHLGSGWEFDVFATTDGWAFRFPRRAEYEALFDRERPVLELARSVLPADISVPLVELVGAPSSEFPFRFAGHRLIEGVAADAIPAVLRPQLARSIGVALGAIHAAPIDSARAAGVPMPAPPNEGALAWLRTNLEGARGLVDTNPVVRDAVAWASTLDPLRPPAPASLSFIHHDLSPEHFVVDPLTGRLTGILDWTFTAIGDAARDFVTCATFAGWDFVEEVLRHYPGQVDAEFRARLRFMAQWLSVMWLGEAHLGGGDVAKHVRWVENAFASQIAA